MLKVSDPSAPYTGTAFTGTVTVTGVGGGPAASLEGVTPTLTYYAGSKAHGSGLATLPTNVGTYTVVASFAGSTNYAETQSAQSPLRSASTHPSSSLRTLVGRITARLSRRRLR